MTYLRQDITLEERIIRMEERLGEIFQKVEKLEKLLNPPEDIAPKTTLADMIKFDR